MDQGDSKPLKICHVVAMPYPGRGHINPTMNLCKRLVLRHLNLQVTFVLTEEWLGFIGSDRKPDRILFATLPNVIPSELVRANDFVGFVDAVYTKLEEPYVSASGGISPWLLSGPCQLLFSPSSFTPTYSQATAIFQTNHQSKKKMKLLTTSLVYLQHEFAIYGSTDTSLISSSLVSMRFQELSILSSHLLMSSNLKP